MKRKAIIIGSGIAGLAVSIRLKSKGYDVEVYEKNDNVGGKLSDFYIGDFRHDFGPKLFTMPDLVEDLYKVAGVDINDYFKYQFIVFILISNFYLKINHYFVLNF